MLSLLILLLAPDTDTDTATGITAISTIEDICCMKFSLSTYRGKYYFPVLLPLLSA